MNRPKNTVRMEFHVPTDVAEAFREAVPARDRNHAIVKLIARKLGIPYTRPKQGRPRKNPE